MKSRKLIYQSGIAITLLAIAWLMYNFMAISIIKPVTLRYEPIDAVHNYIVFLYLGLFYFLIYHIASIIVLLVQIRRYKVDYNLRLITIIMGSISLMMFLGDAALLSDIGKESQVGWDTSIEWQMLRSLHIFHGLYMISVLYLTIKAFREMISEKTDQDIGKDEVIFTAAQYVGILCGVMGLQSIISHLALNRSIEFIKSVIPWNMLFILIPYGILVLFWIVIKFSETPFKWYDEKQWQDVCKTAFITLMISLTAILIFYLTSFKVMTINLALVGFPAILYFALLVFSGGILYFSKFN